MQPLTFQRTAGAAWFALASFVTAAMLISTDEDVGSFGAALSLRNLPTLILVSLLIAVLALPSLVVFLRRSWIAGMLAGIVPWLALWILLQLLQAASSPVDPPDRIGLLAGVVLIATGLTVFVSLPAAVLFRSARQPQPQTGKESV